MTVGTSFPDYVVNEIALGDPELLGELTFQDEEAAPASAPETETITIRRMSGKIVAGFMRAGSAEERVRPRIVSYKWAAFGAALSALATVESGSASRSFNLDPLAGTASLRPGATVRARGEYDRALTELARLRDGWAGPESKAPSASILRDVEHVFAAFDPAINLPNVEVDGDDGWVTLYWQRGLNSFSLILSGDGKVTGVLSPFREPHRPWTLPVNDADKIARRLEDDAIAGLLARG